MLDHLKAIMRNDSVLLKPEAAATRPRAEALRRAGRAVAVFFVRIKDFFIRDLPRAFKNFNLHDGELSTCAIAFFLLISFIPVSLVIISILSFFFDSGSLAASTYLVQIKMLLPSIQINELITRIDKIVFQKRYLAFVWLPFLFWWGSLVFDTVERALEIAFRIERNRKYWKAKIRHFIIIIGISALAVVITLISNLAAVAKNADITLLIEQSTRTLPALKAKLDILIRTPLIFSSLAALAINTFLVFMLYRFIPPKKIDNLSMFKGALFVSFSYEVVKILFSYYITQINDYTSIFGSLSSIVILMIWIWYTCFLFVFGAEVSWVFYERGRDVEHAHP